MFLIFMLFFNFLICYFELLVSFLELLLNYFSAKSHILKKISLNLFLYNLKYLGQQGSYLLTQN
jgi:hypothetical protein